MVAGCFLSVPLIVVGWWGLADYARAHQVPPDQRQADTAIETPAAVSSASVTEAGSNEPDPAYESLLVQWEMVGADRAKKLFIDKDAEWKTLQQIVKDGSPVEILVAVYRYRDRRPKNPFEEELQVIREDALDRIWWERIAELLTRINDPATDATQIESAKRELAGMNYKGDEVPRYRDQRQIARLREQRHEGAFLVWKQRWEPTIVEYRSLPWEIEFGK